MSQTLSSHVIDAFIVSAKSQLFEQFLVKSTIVGLPTCNWLRTNHAKVTCAMIAVDVIVVAKLPEVFVDLTHMRIVKPKQTQMFSCANKAQFKSTKNHLSHLGLRNSKKNNNNNNNNDRNLTESERISEISLASGFT